MNIFNIQNEYKELINQLIDNGGELTPELELSLQINKDQLSSKSENYGYVIKQLDCEIDIIDNEIKRLQQLKKVRQNSIGRLKANIEMAMNTYEIDEINTPLIKINFRKSESVEVEDINELPQMFKIIKVTEDVNKIAIKEALKSGENIKGCYLKTNKNLQIK